uniref:Uncharacterized protein n=1 Tax=Anopheles albimanus TaxID=7167 RepID=A0A182FXK4_ANOAL
MSVRGQNCSLGLWFAVHLPHRRTTRSVQWNRNAYHCAWTCPNCPP